MPQKNEIMEPLLNEKHVAKLLNVSVATLRRRRRHHQPPSWVKLGTRVLYRTRDLESFVEANLVRLSGSRPGDLPSNGVGQ